MEIEGTGKKTQVFGELKFLGFHLHIWIFTILHIFSIHHSFNKCCDIPSIWSLSQIPYL